MAGTRAWSVTLVLLRRDDGCCSVSGDSSSSTRRRLVRPAQLEMVHDAVRGKTPGDGPERSGWATSRSDGGARPGGVHP